MKVLYVAKHNSGGNDDEGAIAFALEKLGHTVVRMREDSLAWRGCDPATIPRYDFCLFHKWHDLYTMNQLRERGVPLVFYYFDLVDWPLDATLSSRCEARKRWMAEVTPLVDLGFCTDGDWVARDTAGKLRVLRQGADERVVGFGDVKSGMMDIDVLFVGGVKGCGVQRESFVRDLAERYGERFQWVDGKYYGRRLADLVATARVVVCPDSPVTDRYWSNRVYVMAGFGAALMIPKCEGLSGSGMIQYVDRKSLFEAIDLALEKPHVLEYMREWSLSWVSDKNLYRHRCEGLVRVVKEQLHV